MPVLGSKTLNELFALNQSFWGSVARDSSVPQSVKSMIYQHLMGHWIPGNLAVVISPLNEGLDHFLLKPVFDLGGTQYHYPSLTFWRAHASIAHEPEGRGCSGDAHSSFLTQDGADPQFIYAVALRNGDIKIEDALGFEKECSFFASANG